MYNANGSEKLDPDTNDPIGGRVNAETIGIQRSSSVAMDVDGDFMIAWQSMDQDGNGYGVYARRYSPAGKILSGTNETQVISFIGRPQGTFKLVWNGNISNNIHCRPIPTTS
jgi:hypothetical protein